MCINSCGLYNMHKIKNFTDSDVFIIYQENLLTIRNHLLVDLKRKCGIMRNK